MDIITHTLIGLTLATPALPAAPLTAACFVIGSVIPDLDALSRLFGKRAFLRCHQTYTHALPGSVIGALCVHLLIPTDLHEPFAPLALAAGMLLHAALDVTNTYGTAILAPLSTRRFCTEWVFFIDAFVTTTTTIALLLQWTTSLNALHITQAYAAAMLLYWLTKATLHTRALRLSPPGTLSLIPSALVPWHYYGCADRPTHTHLFRISALTGHTDQHHDLPTHDDAYAATLSTLPDYRMMRTLSPAYRVTDACPSSDGHTLTCRDLRTRNFGGRFGQLTVTLSPSNQILRSHLNV